MEKERKLETTKENREIEWKACTNKLIPPMCERKVEWKNDTYSNKFIAIRTAEAHLIETMFYDQWAPSGEGSVSKP